MGYRRWRRINKPGNSYLRSAYLLFRKTADTAEASLQNHHLKGLIEVEDTIEAYITFPSGQVFAFMPQMLM